MSDLYMVEMYPQISGLFYFLKAQGLFHQGIEEDPGYGMHAWLKTAFGEMAPKPFRLLMKQGRPPRLLGYSRVDAESLARQMEEFADPSVISACPAGRIASKPMPDKWTNGRLLGFQVVCCPVVRQNKVEKDVFLARIETEGKDSGVEREQVYLQWLRRQLD